jgi:hypothetical protein
MSEEHLTDRMVVSFNGAPVSNSGQLAIGSGITQIHTINTAKPEITAADREALRLMLAELHTLIELRAPSEIKQAAVERADELAETLVAPQPDLNVIGYVKQWFTRYLPQLAGAVTGVIVHPIVGKLVEAAGDGLAAEFKRHFANG